MENTPNQQMQQVTNDATLQTPPPIKPARRNKLILFIAIIIVFLVIVITVVFLIYYSQPNLVDKRTFREAFNEANENEEFKITIEGNSMYPKYNHGEEYTVDVFFEEKRISRGDVVLLYALSQKRTVKRVIGLPGENIMIKDGNIFINGAILEEPYLQPNTATFTGSGIIEGIDTTIPTGFYAVLGDNRALSVDSREWGFVEEKVIEGLVK